MPIVINEFELATEAPQPARGAEREAPAPRPAPAMAEALERELRLLARRMARLAAD